MLNLLGHSVLLWDNLNLNLIKKKNLGESSSFCVLYWTTVKKVWFDGLLRKYFKGLLGIKYQTK